MARGLRQQQHASSSNRGTRKVQGTRNRASPSRLVKLYKKMSESQCNRIKAIGFGGLLNIKCATLPARLANWLMVDCFDAESSELVLPGRGVIKVTAEAVQSVMDLPNNGDEVKYELDVNAINFIQSKYKIARGKAPKIRAIVKRVQSTKRASDDFLRSWLMLAVSTFLCPPTSLGISPRCYPSIMDLSHVKDLNWCQFVVDQLKKSASKMGKRGSVKGCVLFLVILYVDSLLVESVDIPATTPRIAAWSRSLVDRVVKLDTNRDGSFGKLKLKSSTHTVVQSSLFQLDDVRRFVSSKVSSNMSDQKKKKLTTAVSEFCAGFTNLMGTFLKKVSEIEEPSSRTSSHGDGAASECQPPRAEQRQTRARQARQAPEDDQLPDEDEDDGADDDEDDSDDEEDEDEDDGTDDEEDDGGDDEEETAGEYSSSEDTEEESDPLEDGRTPPPDFDDPVDGMFTGNISEDEHSSQDYEPLIARLRRMRKGTEADNQDKGSDKHSSPPVSADVQSPIHSSPERAKDDEGPAIPQPLAFILPDNLKKGGTAHIRKLQLRLPSNPVEQKDAGDGAAPATSVHNVGEGCSFKVSGSENIVQQETGNAAKKQETSNAAKMGPLDFTPPDFNLFDEDDISPTKSAGGSGGATCSLDELAEEDFQKLEDDAIKEIESRKRKALAEEPSSGKLSVTPAYQPPPKRTLKRPAILRSPYVDYTSKLDLKCSKDVCGVYDAVCAHARSTRSQPTETIIVNFWEFFVYLEHLAASVKPGGHLHNTVAEVAIQVIDRAKTHGKPIKRVLPLRVAIFLQSGQLDRNQVTRVFRRADNNLDHSQMVMFPVLEAMGNNGSDTAGHYYLLVLNLRAKRFEVMDSMRSLGDERLRTSCNTIMEGIKTLWRKHYPNSKKDIEDYEPVDIGVPKQSNNHDCGFHMLMHAQHWDGRTIYNFKEEDIPNIRKILTHKWVTHPENQTKWWEKLKLGQQ